MRWVRGLNLPNPVVMEFVHLKKCFDNIIVYYV